MRYRESTARTKFDSEYRILPEKQCGSERVPPERLARPISQACTRIVGSGPGARVLAIPSPTDAKKFRASRIPARQLARSSRANIKFQHQNLKGISPNQAGAASSR